MPQECLLACVCKVAWKMHSSCCIAWNLAKESCTGCQRCRSLLRKSRTALIGRAGYPKVHGLCGRGFTEAPHAPPKEALHIDMHEHLPPALVYVLARVCNADIAKRSVVDGVQPAGTGLLLLSS